MSDAIRNALWTLTDIVVNETWRGNRREAAAALAQQRVLIARTKRPQMPKHGSRYKARQVR